MCWWGRLLGAQLHFSTHPFHSVPCNIALPFIFLPDPLPIPSHPSLYHVPPSFTLTFFLATPLRHCSTFPLSSSSDKNNQSYHKNQAERAKIQVHVLKGSYFLVLVVLLPSIISNLDTPPLLCQSETDPLAETLQDLNNRSSAILSTCYSH